MQQPSARHRQRIDQAPEQEQENLLAVAQVMAQMRYNDAGLLAVFGGTPVFDDSPLVLAAIDRASKKITRNNMEEAVLQVLEARFEAVPPALVESLHAVADEGRLRALLREAARCSSLNDFQTRLTSPAS